MSIFATELKKAIKEKNIKQLDFSEKTDGLISQSGISSFMKKTIPSPDKIDKMAELLGKSSQELRKFAALDLINRVLEKYGVSNEEIFKDIQQVIKIKYQLPVFKLTSLLKSLSEKGYPIKEPDFIVNYTFDFGTYAYGIFFENYLFRRVTPGEIAVVSPDYKKGPAEDFAVVRTKKQIFVARIIIHPLYVILEEMSPHYSTVHLKKSDILFLHRIVNIFRPEAVPGLFLEIKR